MTWDDRNDDPTPRPVYESQRDRDEEAYIKGVVEEKWDCELSKMPMSYHLDFLAMRDGKVVAAIETKRRSVRRESYRSIMVSVSKLFAARRFKETMGVDTIFIIHYNDCIAWISLNEKPDAFGFGGRDDRNDPADQEPVAFFDIPRLTVI